ncbi:MAG: hypothetical protein HS120_05315 [Burkholderiales bacterium]|nr:hypothetical protein [Burkholderiales bacterium]
MPTRKHHLRPAEQALAFYCFTVLQAGAAEDDADCCGLIYPDTSMEENPPLRSIT